MAAKSPQGRQGKARVVTAAARAASERYEYSCSDDAHPAFEIGAASLAFDAA